MEKWRIKIRTCGRTGIEYYTEAFEDPPEQVLLDFRFHPYPWSDNGHLTVDRARKIMATLCVQTGRTREFTLPGAKGYKFMLVRVCP